MNSIALARVVRTIRHLRISQLRARSRRIIRRNRRAPHVAPDDLCSRVHHALYDELQDLPDLEHAGEKGADCLQLLEGGNFRHLNQTVHLGTTDPGWQLGKVAKNRLWTITLHYHQWLYELTTVYRDGNPAARDQSRRLICRYLNDWLAKCDLNMPGAESLACNPYAIATRLGFWVRAFFVLDPDFTSTEPELTQRWLNAAWRQAEYLFRNLEWDLRANHLLRDAVGLAWAGRFFAGDQPRRWLQMATRIAVEQSREQVLDDGGHFERSPYYHLEVMDDFQTLAVLLREPEAKRWMTETWRRMADFAHWMQHPDGTVAQFNDSARRSMRDEKGRESEKETDPSCAKQPALTERPLPRSGKCARPPRSSRGGRYFGEFGMIVWRGEPWTMFFDVGAVGPDYQPGHAHADTLSLECSFRGQRLFIDPGCHSYDHDERRRYDRSTDAHNTVCIDGEDSSEVWHIFRVGRRARPLVEGVHIHASGLSATASHTGYDHLPGRPRHTRQLAVDEDGRLQIRDRVAGGQRHQVTGGFLVEPDWSVKPTTDGWLLSRGSESLSVRIVGPREMTLSIEPRPVHPDYGIELLARRMQWTYAGELPIDVVIVVEEDRGPTIKSP